MVNGGLNAHSITPGGIHFARTPRDLAQYVHADFSGQISTNAALLLLSYGPKALDPNHPYIDNPTQGGFVTYGQAYILFLLQIAAEESLKAAWYQKWQVHRRLRPEEFGFFVNAQRDGKNFGISSELIESPVLPLIIPLMDRIYCPKLFLRVVLHIPHIRLDMRRGWERP